ncbi:aldo/keto reductase [Jiangella mangrovi]|uniref:Aryl-alcohol dehydrogenase-like predicted oxidoreductase n=1 Tax=Jiangella mangrovi TaxID=1524084 RepID=A0A7W9GPM7_9ACTN|nr:aldo/keto reductase [Jiangella mangrovi]MBB5787509.1 aryl-alcohol dehydrogenase-like predicted oxidoreductase [Jiangella mangrovi]
MTSPRDPLAVRGIGLGLAALGRPGYLTLGHGRDFTASASVDELRDRTHAVLDAAWAAGVRYVDAARSYGLAERFLGEWLAARPGRRAELTVGSKWGYTYTADWRVDAAVHEVKDHSAATFERQWQETLDALGGPPDVYLVHSLTSDSPALGDRVLLDRLAELAADGVRVGFSSSGPDQAAVIDRALALTADAAAPFGAVQATWNLLEPSAGPALARAHDAGWFVVAKETLANGRLTGRGDVAPFRAAADAAGVAPDALALGVVLRQPFVDIALSGATTVDQLLSNLRAPESDGAALEDLAEDPAFYWANRSGLVWT